MLVKKSPQRDTKLEKIQKAHVEDGENPSPTIRMLCPTRWTVKADAMDSILKNYDCLMELWEWSLSHVKDTNMKARIRGVRSHMSTVEYFYGLTLGECLLRHADNLSATLQTKDMSAAEGKTIAFKTVNAIETIRSDACFDLFGEKVTREAVNSDVDHPEIVKRQNT